MIKLLAIDIDGTLTEKDGRINLDATFLLRKLQEDGLQVVLATGRSVFETYTLSKFLGFAKFGISENGGVIFFNEPTKIKIFGDYADSLLAYEFLSKNIEKININQRMPRLTEILLERNFDINAANRILKENGYKAKILDSGVAYHLSSVNVNKGVALKYVAEKMNLKKEEIASIGDSEVDEPMFAESGFSFLVNKNYRIKTNEVEETTKLIITERQGPMGIIEAIEWLINNDLIPYRTK
ncbi:MAG: phosphoglycolate phosphatase [Nitrososphaeria archaeon]|nr:phosphoglycolate phosphatase [Conexivisphaerales archaeon]